VRGKTLIALLALFLLAFGAGYIHQQTRLLERERVWLETEIELLEVENAHLRLKLQELHSRQSEILRRMEEWLDAWEVDIWESTAYAPLDPWAREGMCYAGNPRVTASGAEVVPGITAAAGPDIPFGTRAYVMGDGPRIIQDRGGRIENGSIDLAVETRDEALEWGRRTVKVVYEKWRFNKAFAGTAVIRLNAIGF